MVVRMEAKAKMKKNRQENKSASLPVKISDFQPRIDKYTCQYCGYTSRNCDNVDVHVNTQHEMQEWFKCMICKYVTLNYKQMKIHLHCYHKLKVAKAEVRKLIIKDLKEILEHKKAIINKKNLKTKIGKKSEFIPIDEENFKLRKYSKICQYCDYRSHSQNVDEHVNACHEMIHWYQCNQCPYVTLQKCSLRGHVLTMHNQKLTSTFINDLIIKDQVKIDHLKKSNILKKKRKDEFSKIPSEQLSKESKFIPIDNADFKPRIYPLICQYCSFSRKSKQQIDVHVNSHHEFTTWFKCDECDYAALLSRSIKSHLIVQHLGRNVNKDKIEKLLVKDQKEIDQLKKKWTEKKQVQKADNKQFSELLQDQQMYREDYFQSESDGGSDALIKLKASSVASGRLDTQSTKDYCVGSDGKVNDAMVNESDDELNECSTRGIKKEETLLKKDNYQMKEEYGLENEGSDEYNKDALDGLDEEWLTGPSW